MLFRMLEMDTYIFISDEFKDSTALSNTNTENL